MQRVWPGSVNVQVMDQVCSDEAHRAGESLHSSHYRMMIFTLRSVRSDQKKATEHVPQRELGVAESVILHSH